MPGRRYAWVTLALTLALALPAWAGAVRGAEGWPPVRRGAVLEFPRDHGAHPEYRIEWWYLTGWLETPQGSRGFQLTFFRSRPRLQEHLPTRFAAAQLLFAHAAVADAPAGRLRQAEKAAREGFGLAVAERNDTHVTIDDWVLRRDGDAYIARARGSDFSFDLRVFADGMPVWLQGAGGVSQKAPDPGFASHYYSRPHLRVAGQLVLDGGAMPVTGVAWLDHEWASALLPPGAVGWDWSGINFDDGAALMAFRLRDRHEQPLWSAATWREPGGHTTTYGPTQVHWRPLRTWQSPHSGTRYPVAMELRLGGRVLHLSPLLDDQEIDARRSVGMRYWEGAVRVAPGDGQLGPAGRGYLELTGYGARVRY